VQPAYRFYVAWARPTPTNDKNQHAKESKLKATIRCADDELARKDTQLELAGTAIATLEQRLADAQARLQQAKSTIKWCDVQLAS
jgi:chromosome segregation ATPase